MKQIFIIVSLISLNQFVFAQSVTSDFKSHLVLNGTTNYVNIPANATMALTGNATVEAIVRTDNATLVSQDIIFINCIEPDHWGIQLRLQDGKPTTGIVISNTEYDLISSTPLTPNQTYHLAGVRDGSILYLYINGILNAQRTVPVNTLRTSVNSISRIGKPQNYQGQFFFGGCLDELRVWNVARTQTEILANKDVTLGGNETGLVAYYQFNDSTAGQNAIIKNSAILTGNALDGTTVGDLTTPYISDTCPSVYCNSLVFDSLPLTTVIESSSYCFNGSFKNFYDSAHANYILASVNENGQSLGNIFIDDYVDDTAGIAGTDRYMRRHYLITSSIVATNTKRFRLYYSDSDFADLQKVVPALTSSSQLAVTEYHGLHEDGVYDTSEGTTNFIPSSAITTGNLFGQNYLEFTTPEIGEFWIHTGSSVLPLHFIDFNALKTNNQVKLSWTTENEINVDRYEVERSFNSIGFSTISKVKANNAGLYRYDDNLIDYNGSNVYYRIKMVDKDGRFTYSKTVPINIAIKQPFAIYPNPVKDVLYVQVQRSVAEKVSLQIVDMQGNIVLQQSHQLSAGVTSLSANTTALAKGTYFAVIKGQTTEKKIFIKE